MKQKSRKIPKCVREEEFIQLIKIIPKKDMKKKVAFLLAYASGMRISEVLRCRQEHFRNNSIFIPESKYGVERVVPLPRGWKQDFFKYLPINLTPRALQISFKKYCAKAKLPLHYTFHSLRHGFATTGLEKGIPINQISVLLGHSSIATTDIYTKANPIDAIKSYEEYF